MIAWMRRLLEEQRIDFMLGGQPSEGGWRGRGGHHYVPTKVCLLISELLYHTKSRIKVVLSVRVGVSGKLYHLDSSTDTTGHDDGYFGLNVLHIYLVLICLLHVK